MLNQEHHTLKLRIAIATIALSSHIASAKENQSYGNYQHQTQSNSYQTQSKQYITPNGQYVNSKQYTITPSGSYVSGKSWDITPNGQYIGRDK